MGLDMCLRGRVNNYKQNEEFRLNIEGAPPYADRVEFDLGYWRKQPDLHGFIVKNFTFSGEDTCEPITLSEDDLHKIIKAVKEDNLPATDGFFFGEHDYSEEMKEDTLGMLYDAVRFLKVGDEKPTEGVYRAVIYQASW